MKQNLAQEESGRQFSCWLMMDWGSRNMPWACNQYGRHESGSSRSDCCIAGIYHKKGTSMAHGAAIQQVLFCPHRCSSLAKHRGHCWQHVAQFVVCYYSGVVRQPTHCDVVFPHAFSGKTLMLLENAVLL